MPKVLYCGYKTTITNNNSLHGKLVPWSYSGLYMQSGTLQTSHYQQQLVVIILCWYLKFAITESLQVTALGIRRDIAMVVMDGLEESKIVLTV